MEFIPIEQVQKQIVCPFCRGSEDETPIPIVVYRPDGSVMNERDDPSNWVSRVIPNKFPSLIQPVTERDCGPYCSDSQDGIQELVIPTPRHVSSIADLTDKELEICLMACQERVSVLRSQPEIKHVMLFMNCRSAAGASLEHIHFQIMGSPLLSPYLVARKQRNEQHVSRFGESLVASLLGWELSQKVRVVEETERFVMFCPYASRFAFQVWIVPKDPTLRFSRNGDFNTELGGLCRRYTQQLEDLIDKAAYNMLVNLAPNDSCESEHWFVEMFPRLNRMAGYEIGTDIWVNPVPPETAAKRLSG